MFSVGIQENTRKKVTSTIMKFTRRNLRSGKHCKNGEVLITYKYCVRDCLFHGLPCMPTEHIMLQWLQNMEFKQQVSKILI